MTRHLFDRFAVTGIAVAALAWPAFSSAQLALSDTPLYISAPVSPLVMLDMSKDQQLYKKAYNDYSDLDGDGQVETTYKNTIDYYGYFDPAKCYTYQSDRFEPTALATSDSSLPTFQKFNTDTRQFESVTLAYYYNSDLKIYVLADPNLAPTAYYNAGTKGSTEWVEKTPAANDLPKHYCDGKSWSGNFLNWVSMARVDAVRKLLYGGLRQKDMDTKAITVLERTYLPTDAHSWVKYYNGSDISKLTPFTNPTLTPSNVTSTSSNTIGTGTKTFDVSDTSLFSVGDQILIFDKDGTAPTGSYMIGAVSCVNGTGIKMYNTVGGSETCSSGQIKVAIESGGVVGSGAGKTSATWTLNNWTKTGISFCNTTLNGGSPNDKSQTNTNAPLIRYASGNYALWAANERWQCMTRGEIPGENTGGLSNATGTNGNRASQSGSFANSISPPAATNYNALIKACDSSWLGSERCKLYPSGNYKPIGLLQIYGESGLLKFGLMTGSYDKNISGGVLRKNISSITDEINTTTDGTFKTPIGGNIITTLSKLRIYGYYSGGNNAGSYLDSGGDNCSWQQVSLKQGDCRSWGNPMAEIYYETLRYLAGKTTPTSDYVYTDSGSADNKLGLPLATWSDPLTDKYYCSPLSVLVFNASVSTNEYRRSSPTPSSSTNTSKADLAGIALTDINGSSYTPASRAKDVGDGEGITDNYYFIGKTLQGGAYVPATSATDYELCTAKKVSSLGEVYGICPEGPTLEGSYLMPGLAYQAHINRIRADLPSVKADDKTSLKVTTYGVQLATNVPRLAIPVPGSKTGQQVIIQPAYRLVMAGVGSGGGSLVDMQVIYRSYSTTTASGLVYLNWEDSEQGGDYDQDVWGILRYCVTTAAGGCDVAMGLSGTSANAVYVMTNTVAQSTNKPQGFGYIITGTTQDGPHFHSGIESFQFTDPQNITIVSPATPSTAHIGASGGCEACVIADVATIAKYTISSTTGNSLKDPLYYAAKWGAFKDSNDSLKPDVQDEWDSKKTDGSKGSDDIPDTYFLVSNPLALEKALNTAFVLIVKSSSASAVATNSTSLNTNTYVYQAKFSPADWSGSLLAYKLGTDAVLATTPAWEAGVTDSPDTRLDYITRVILTITSSQTGAAFDWDSLASDQQHYLANATLGSTLTDDQKTYGKAVLAYLRGKADNEPPKGQFRARLTSKLGDIVDSNPLYVGTPQGQYEDPNLLSQAYTSSSTYWDWRKGLKDRKAIIYVGANDGMLHGFDASNGVEKLAFVPNAVYPNLTALISPTYSNSGASEHKFFVDGSPAIADVEFISYKPTGWRTILASGLGKGGRAVFALDVSDPSKFSQANTATVLWEFSNTSVTKPSTDAGELGYVYGKPLIAKTNNGKWAAVFGNGYNSDSQKASLFIVFIENAVGNTELTAGTDYIRIPVALTGVDATNGLSAINAIDVDGDGTIDYIYGGDLLGNLWKFDVSNTDSTKWGVAEINKVKQPLFVACTGPATDSTYAGSCPFSPNKYVRQPITTRPELSFHPTHLNDVMVYFGTGQYLTSEDTKNETTQTMYGIWDKDTTSGTSARPNRSTLQPQTIVDSDKVAGARTFQGIKPGEETLSKNYSYPVNWNTKYGWYEDLPATKERMVGMPKLVRGILFYNTFIPTSDPCSYGGTGYLMAVDYATGGMPKTVVFLTGTSFGDSAIVSGIQVGAGIGGSVIIMPVSKDNPGVAVMSTPAGQLKAPPINPGALAGTRISWRELNP